MRLGLVAARQLSPALTVAAANCLARLAASPASCPPARRLGVRLSPSRPAGSARLSPRQPARPAAVMCDKEFMWALKNGDLDEVKDYVAKVSGDGAASAGWRRGRGRRGELGCGRGRARHGDGAGAKESGESGVPQTETGGFLMTGAFSRALLAFLTPWGEGKGGDRPLWSHC